jgi:hypothetical protein
MSYGSFESADISKDDENRVTCNYLGVDWPTLSAANGSRPSYMVLLAGAVMVIFLTGW